MVATIMFEKEHDKNQISPVSPGLRADLGRHSQVVPPGYFSL
jgi:hypothetical protein